MQSNDIALNIWHLSELLKRFYIHIYANDKRQVEVDNIFSVCFM